MPRQRGRRTAAAAATTLALGVLAGCGGGETGPPVLTWYINPDSGGQAEIARRCSEASGGRYTVEVAPLPRESAAQREQLVRRLAANDSSIDLVSLDPPYVAEFAEAGFLADVPDDVAERVSEGVVESALTGATWRDELVVIPFWANTQLLWYKQSVAEAAGLDMAEPVTFEQVITAAQEQGTTFAVQGRRAEALPVFLNALISSAGGAIITDPDVERPEDVQLGLTEEPAVRAAEVLRSIVDAGVGGPALGTAGEDANVEAFEAGSAGFMLNWPFIWPRASANVEAGALDASVVEDYGWTTYPQVVEGEESRPPYGGIDLGVGAFSEHTDFAFEVAECVVSDENQSYYFATNGNPASSEAVYDDPAVLEAFPMAPVIRESLDRAAPRPQTPYYSEVSASLQRVYHPYSSISPDATGREAADLIRAVLAKEELL